MHLAVIVVHGLLDTVSALLNHFPLFALMLRIKDPMRLPGMQAFPCPRAMRLTSTRSPCVQATAFRLSTPRGLTDTPYPISYLYPLPLQNEPAPLSSVFAHYGEHTTPCL